jgi:hypothetical protein
MKRGQSSRTLATSKANTFGCLLAIESRGFFFSFSFYVSYSTLLHLPSLGFHCVRGCWDHTQDCCDRTPWTYTLTGYFLHCHENHVYVVLFWELRGLVPKFHTHVSERFKYSQDRSTYFLQQNRQIDRGNTVYKLLTVT